MSSFQFPSPQPKEFWNGASIQTRQSWLQSFFIAHPDLKRIFSDFQEKLYHCERSKKYEAMLILGETGSGKTTLTKLLSDYSNHEYSRADEEKTIRPVIQFAIPDPCTPFEISVSILAALGELHPRQRKNKADTIKAAQLLMNTCEVKCVLIDNFQDIPARRARRGIELVGARLRELIDASSALWVFLGTEDALKVVDSDPQLIKRVAYRARLRYFKIENANEQRNFRFLLKKVDEWLPLSEPSCLQDVDLAKSIYLATQGVFDRLVQLVDRAWYECVTKGRERMDRSDMHSAFAYVYGPTSSHINTFSDNFVVRQLTAKNEPFEVLAKVQEEC